ncbi:MAG: PDZ domain-containing protein, partial [Acidobacteriota bacterium]|nr:PDZ domain-containing protein [Acidobacteriota bacterium]
MAAQLALCRAGLRPRHLRREAGRVRPDRRRVRGCAVVGIPHWLVVAEIRPGSAAEHSGLHVRDVILEVNRKPVNSLSSYARALKSG